MEHIRTKQDVEKTLESRNIAKCPFCNNKAIEYYIRTVHKASEYKVAIRCKHCKAIGPINVVNTDNPYKFACIEVALDDWNNRDSGYVAPITYQEFY